MDDELQLLRNRVEKLERFSAGLYQVVGQCAVTAHATTLTTKAIGVYITNLAKVEGRLKPVIPLLEELEELALKLQASVREFDFNEEPVAVSGTTLVLPRHEGGGGAAEKGVILWAPCCRGEDRWPAFSAPRTAGSAFCCRWT